MVAPLSFPAIEKQIRAKSFGVLSTISPRGYSQSTGVLFGVSASDPFVLYIYSNRTYTKVQNILHNPYVSFVIPFPHHFFRFVPANTIALQAQAEVLTAADAAARASFQSHRILRMVLEGETRKDDVFLRLVPLGRLHVYGLGYSLFKLRNNHQEGSYFVNIPNH